MKTAAKWVTIIWSVICLIGVIAGLAEVGNNLGEPMDEYETAGAGIGLGCGLFVWFVLWVVIAGPAVIIWMVSGKKETQPTIEKRTSLCVHCGKYYEGKPTFCPNCGSKV